MDNKEKRLMIQLIEFLRGTLNADDVSPDFFQNVLIKTIDLIPEAQAGSATLLQDDGLYHYVATSGYDLKELSKVTFAYDSLSYMVKNADKKSFIIRDLAKLHSADLDKKSAKILRSKGRAAEIQSTLVLPIKLMGKIVATLTLDNFDDEHAFDNNAKNIAEVLGLEIAIAIKQINLVNELREARTNMKQEIEIIAQEAAIYSRSLNSRVDKLDLGKYDKKNELSKRQEQILGFLAQGKSVAQISDILDLRRQTVRNYLSGVYKTKNISTRKELLAWARDNDY